MCIVLTQYLINRYKKHISLPLFFLLYTDITLCSGSTVEDLVPGTDYVWYFSDAPSIDTVKGVLPLGSYPVYVAQRATTDCAESVRTVLNVEIVTDGIDVPITAQN